METNYNSEDIKEMRHFLKYETPLEELSLFVPVLEQNVFFS